MDKIINNLRKILFEIKEESFNDVDEDINLFSEKFNLEPRDMVYLMLFIERDFNIIFSEDKINDFSFYTLRNMSKEIYEKIKEG